MSRLKHLFICREFPPAAYPPGGIGTYVRVMADLLAKAGETVHVIAHRWDGAPDVRTQSLDGRLIVHRVALDDPTPAPPEVSPGLRDAQLPRGLLASSFPSQAFSWQAALLAERLVETEGIDVIEAQEWEAPLYYLQLRRALELGPARHPPCIVHVHSPSEQIFAANGWETAVADYRPAVTLEEYSIIAADALFCPSRFVAEQVQRRYRIDPARISVIPYPLGDTPHIDRGVQVWSAGSICYVGRLECRKGVLEWADAVALVAAERSIPGIEFVGGDTPLRATGGPTVGDAIRARVPRHLRRRFRFHGRRDRAGVLDVLARACVAVVPSRWENLPYSCIEAMGTGLPVIASPNGGMRELLTDGVSGWIAADTTPAGLAGALRRALDTPAAQRERMGDAATAAVRRACGNETIVRRHLEEKNRLAVRGASRAPSAPAHLLRASAEPPGHAAFGQSASPVNPRRGIGVVVTGRSGSPRLASCVSGIRAQAEPPAAVALVCDSPPDDAATIGGTEGWEIMPRGERSFDDTAITAAEWMVSRNASLAGLAFVDPRVRLDPAFTSTSGTVLARSDRLGILSGWFRETAPGDRVHVQPCAAQPHLGRDGKLAPFVTVRTQAFTQALGPAGDGRRPCSLPELIDRILRSGWGAVTYPAVLGSIELDPGDGAAAPDRARYSSMARAVQRLHTPILQWLRACPREERRALLRQGLASPTRSGWWLARRALRRWRVPSWRRH